MNDSRSKTGNVDAHDPDNAAPLMRAYPFRPRKADRAVELARRRAILPDVVVRTSTGTIGVDPTPRARAAEAEVDAPTPARRPVADRISASDSRARRSPCLRPRGLESTYSDGSEGIEASHDGSVIAGVGYLDSPPAQQGFRWSETGGLSLLPEILAGGADEGGAFGVSPDGQVVVGQSRGLSGNVEAVRWIGGGPAESLGIPPGAARANGDASTADGSVVVGRASSLDFGTRIGFVWDATNGIRSASDYLELELGLDVAEWEIEELRDISPDGQFIVETGINPAGDREGFIVAVPEPASGPATAVAIGSVLALVRARMRTRGVGDQF